MNQPQPKDQPPPQPDEERRIQAYKELSKNANIPEEKAGNFGRVKQLPAWETLRTFFKSKMRAGAAMRYFTGAVVGIYGPIGSSKTTLAVAFMDSCMNIGLSTRYTKARDYLRLVNTMSGRTIDWNQIEEDFESPRLLVIDDVDSMPDWAKGEIFHIASKRADETRWTILIGNSDQQTFANNLGETLSQLVSVRGGTIKMEP